MSYNVNRSVTDAFYRYKMPKLLAKVEGKGNGIKTVIVNMVDVAKAIGCPPTYPCKFFGCELGAQTQFDFKNDRYIVNGSHDATKLQQLLDVFIKKFILCTECDNPETSLFPNEKKGIIKQTCKACGHQTQLDMRHKLTTFILKNPPDVKPDQLGNSKTQKKHRTKNSLQPGSPNGGTNSASDNDANGDDDDDWAVDVSDAAVAERMKDLSAGVKHLTVSNHADRSQAERLELFYDYCKVRQARGHHLNWERWKRVPVYFEAQVETTKFINNLSYKSARYYTLLQSEPQITESWFTVEDCIISHGFCFG